MITKLTDLAWDVTERKKAEEKLRRIKRCTAKKSESY